MLLPWCISLDAPAPHGPMSHKRVRPRRAGQGYLWQVHRDPVASPGWPLAAWSKQLWARWLDGSAEVGGPLSGPSRAEGSTRLWMRWLAWSVENAENGALPGTA